MSNSPNLDLPAAWRARLSRHEIVAFGGGQSGALMFKLHAADQPDYFVKADLDDDQAVVAGEAVRLRWLRDQGVPCPEVLAHTQYHGQNWLLMRALAGSDLERTVDLDPSDVAAIAAFALRRLHRIKIENCPFNLRLDARFAEARDRVEAGLVDELDFDDSRMGTPARELLELAEGSRPPIEDLVVTHGDATLANLVASSGQFQGFIDCGRLGIADRHLDLALMLRELSDHFGQKQAEEFIQLYGLEVDPHRVAFYQLLDEFF